MSDRVLSGAEAIVVERWRQVTVEGWDADHDRGLDEGQLIAGAVAYALNAWGDVEPARWWPFNPDRFKPSDPSVAGRIKDLVKAGAMIASEIDRLTRQEVERQRQDDTARAINAKFGPKANRDNEA